MGVTGLSMHQKILLNVLYFFVPKVFEVAATRILGIHSERGKIVDAYLVEGPYP